jgi:hypothetical protein
MAQRGKLLFSDDFERTELGDAWRVSVRSFRIEAGAMLAGQRPEATHPAVSRTSVPFKDAVIAFRFKFDGGPRFNVVFNDKAYDGSHAGHICRVGIGPSNIQLGDDKEGTMKNEIYALRQDEKTKAQTDPLLVGRTAKVNLKLDAGEWHWAMIEIVGDEMLVSIDGQPIGYLQSPGIAHPTKSEWGFTASGQSYRFDNVQVWTAQPDPQWPERREQLRLSLSPDQKTLHSASEQQRVAPEK